LTILIERVKSLHYGNILDDFCQVEEDPEESEKTAYINFKRVVWHEAFFLLLKTIISHSKTGYWIECADKVKHWLFPVILILSADFEEQEVTFLPIVLILMYHIDSTGVPCH
jgi:hypothetical protein